MSHLTDDALPIAADVLDMVEASLNGDHRTLAITARRAHRDHGIEALILLATIASGFAQQIAYDHDEPMSDVLAGMRKRAAA